MEAAIQIQNVWKIFGNTSNDALDAIQNKKISKQEPTIPSTINDELACNIFLRAKNLKDFIKLRDLKDNY